MAAAVEKEAGLGVPMRMMIQNALNKKGDLAETTTNHFTQVTGHAASSGWGDFADSMSAAFANSDEAEGHICKMVEALGFHEDNFANHFEKHKFDKEATHELREDLHESASIVGEYIGAVVDAVHAALKEPENSEKVSDAYEAGYDLADLLHATHVRDEDDTKLLDAEAAHDLSQLEMKNYRSPIAFHPPDQIGESVRKKAGRLWGATKRKGRSLRRTVAKKFVPKGVRRAFRNRNVNADSTIALGGRSAIPEAYVRRGCVVQILDTNLLEPEENQSDPLSKLSLPREAYQIGDAEQNHYSIVPLSRPRGGLYKILDEEGNPRRIKNPRTGAIEEEWRDLDFAPKRSDLQYFYSNFTASIDVTSTSLRAADGRGGAAQKPDFTGLVIGGKNVPQNVLLYNSPGDLQPSASAVIFPQSEVPYQQRLFTMTKNAVVQINVEIEIKTLNKPTEMLYFNAIETKFNANDRKPMRLATLIGAKPSNLVLNQTYTVEDLTRAGFGYNSEDGGVKIYSDVNGTFIAIDKNGVYIDYTDDNGNWASASTSESALLFPEKEGEDFSTTEGEDDYFNPRMADQSTNTYQEVVRDKDLVASFEDLMKDKKMMVMQIKKHDTEKRTERQERSSSSLRPFVVCGVGVVPQQDGQFTLDGVMLIFPRKTPKRVVPRSQRSASVSEQRASATGYREARQATRTSYKKTR